MLYIVNESEIGANKTTNCENVKKIFKTDFVMQQMGLVICFYL